MTDGYTIIPLSPIRKAIAARVSEAARTVPHFRLIMDINFGSIINLRKELKRDSTGVAPSLNDFLIKACAETLTEVPEINTHWVENAIHQYRTADISVVMAIEGGLVTPVVRCCNEKSVWEIAREVRELARRALHNELKVKEILGGSFSLSNLGMFGVDQFDAIVNPPQCAILAVGAAKPMVVVTADGDQAIAPMVRITLSCDHRAIDGATAAKFLSALRTRMERPDHFAKE
jgi:pyruvate dehydrogenase E2 component (dihydrolipoamide acetyltransferase)